MKKITLFTLATLLACPLIADVEIEPVDYALELLQASCSDYVAVADQSVEANDLALYCLTAGEVIAIQAASSPAQVQQVKITLEQWRQDLAPALAFQ
ncbi:hypothetical protein [Marinagarivorans algicola]|uniref:hypothetical protein n=1 Tax=Marinagarivorans algicola TaxID=1513270 RepID=UPI003735E718